jgi:hypothetical protein
LLTVGGSARVAGRTATPAAGRPPPPPHHRLRVRRRLVVRTALPETEGRHGPAQCRGLAGQVGRSGRCRGPRRAGLRLRRLQPLQRPVGRGARGVERRPVAGQRTGCRGGPVDGLRRAVERRAGLGDAVRRQTGMARAFGGPLPHVARRLGAAPGQAAHLGRHRRAGGRDARHLGAGVPGQGGGAEGDAVDHRDDAVDAPRGRGQVLHRRAGRGHLRLAPAGGIGRLGDRPGGVAGLVGMPAQGGAELRQRVAGLPSRGRLAVGALGQGLLRLLQPRAGGVQGIGLVPHLAHRPGRAGPQAFERARRAAPGPGRRRAGRAQVARAQGIRRRRRAAQGARHLPRPSAAAEQRQSQAARQQSGR